MILLRFWPDWRKALMFVNLETVIGWDRKGFRLYWNWKSRGGRIGRPGIPKEIRKLIREMSATNALCEAGLPSRALPIARTLPDLEIDELSFS